MSQVKSSSAFCLHNSSLATVFTQGHQIKMKIKAIPEEGKKVLKHEVLEWYTRIPSREGDGKFFVLNAVVYMTKLLPLKHQQGVKVWPVFGGECC